MLYVFEARTCSREVQSLRRGGKGLREEGRKYDELTWIV